MPSLPARVIEHAGGSHFISLLILSINVALFVLMGIAESKAGGGGNSFLGPASDSVLTNFGMRRSDLINQGQWWRLVTPNFLHLGMMHLMFNSLALYQIGPLAEELYGSQKFLFIYLGTGVLSNVAAYLFNVTGGGASGAIFGLIGLLVIYGYRAGGEAGRALTRQMLIWAGVGMLYGFVFHADNISHAGGFAAGTAFGFLLVPGAPSTQRDSTAWNVSAIACVAVIAASFAFAAAGYGRTATNEDVANFANAFGQVEAELGRSFILKNAKAADLTDAAARLRSYVSDVNRVKRIDGRSEDVRKRITGLAGKRAADLEEAAKAANPAPLFRQEESAELEVITRDFWDWFNSVAASYGVRRVR